MRALSRAGEVDEAAKAAEKWLDRDELDPEALTYLSDAVGRQGKRDEALRLLTGVVDLSPDNAVLQKRLAHAFDRAGEPDKACAHRIALAESSPDDVDLVADAVRCERALGHDPSAQRMLDAVSDAHTRDRIAAAAGHDAAPSRPHGDLLLDATWGGPEDVDLTLVTPQGTRLSFMGGRVNVVGADAHDVGHEVLGLGRTAPGSYVLEVSRTTASAGAPVDGRIAVTVLGTHRVLRFHLTGARAEVGRVDVTRHARLVPVSLAQPPFYRDVPNTRPATR